MSMNRIVLVGRLTKDPELRYTPGGDAVASFTLAVNRNFKAKNGEQEADFINIVAWKKQGENAANYLKKGSQAGVDGRLQVRNYGNSEGKRVYVTEVVAESVQFLDSKGTGSGASGRSDTNTQSASNNRSQGNTRIDDDPFASGGKTIDINDDDLPF